MPNILDSLRDATKRKVDTALRRMPGLFDRFASQPLSPVHSSVCRAGVGGDTPQPLREFVRPALERPFRGVDIPLIELSGPVGSGKTVATCQLQREMSMAMADRVCVWMPMGLHPPDLTGDTAPADLIPRYFGLQGSCEPEDISLVVLDGLDEFLYQRHGPDRRRQASSFLQALLNDGIPVVVGAREVAMRSGSVRRCLNDLAGLGASKQLGLEMALWKDTNARRRALAERVFGSLTQGATRIPAAGLLNLLRGIARDIPQGVLEWPLLFGMAYDVLALAAWRLWERVNGQHGKFVAELELPASLGGERSLMEEWVTEGLKREGILRNSPSSAEDRRSVLRRFALLAAVSGRGVSGLSSADLQPERWVWGPLTPQTSDPGGGDGDFEQRSAELTECCLLWAAGDEERLRVPHPQILAHLAAEALEELACGSGSLGLHETPKAPALKTLWDEVGFQAGHDRFSLLGGLLERKLGESAADPETSLHQTFQYWHKHWPAGEKSFNLDLPGLYGPHRKQTTEAGNDAVLMRQYGTVSRLLPQRTLGHLAEIAPYSTAQPIERAELGRSESVVFHRNCYLRVPRGTHFIWTVDEEGNVLPVPFSLPEDIYLMEGLVPVWYYLEYLRENPRARLPQGITRDRAGCLRSSHEMDAPIQSISARETGEFAAWVNEKLRGTLGGRASRLGVRVCLPRVVDLQIAVSGRTLALPGLREVGWLGHQHLLYPAKQHTDEFRHRSDGQQTTFGRMELLAEDRPDLPTRERDSQERRMLFTALPELIQTLGLEEEDPHAGVRLKLMGQFWASAGSPGPGKPDEDTSADEHLSSGGIGALAQALAAATSPEVANVVHNAMRHCGFEAAETGTGDFVQVWESFIKNPEGCSGQTARITHFLLNLTEELAHERRYWTAREDFVAAYVHLTDGAHTQR